MTSQYRHRRTSNPATPAPNPIEPGEIAVNTANRQLHLGDAASATLGTPKPLIAIRYFDTAAQYVTNDFVVNGTALYRAKNATGPGAFTASDWAMMVGTIDPQYVAKAGDTMSGMLSLPSTTPTVGTHATNKTYVDNLVALKSSVIVSDVKPVPDPIDSTLWYNTLDGQMYIRYNDGNSTQWVIAAPQPDIGQFVNKTGDTMTGDLTISKAGPTLVMNKPDATTATVMSVRTAASKRWEIVPSFGATEDFYVSRYNDAGTYAGNPLIISRATGIVDFEKKPTVAGAAWAAPMDALAYSGMQINGSFEVSQERGTFAATAAGQYVLDGWIHSWGGTAVLNSAQYPYGSFGQPNIIGCTVATAQASMGAGDLYYFIQNLEGYRVSRLGWGGTAAQPMTIAFWTQHQRAGLYSLAVRNGAANRSYVATYTQDVANTREYKTITIPGCPDGTWPMDNTRAMTVSFAMACGTTFTAPSVNTWLTGNYVAASGQVNAVASTSDVFRLISVIILPGIEAPSAARAPFIMRPYDQELTLCQRYYEKVTFGGIYSPQAGGAATLYTTLRWAEKRALPSGGLLPGTNVSALGWNFAGVDIPLTAIGLAVITGHSGMFQWSGVSVVGVKPFTVYLDARI